MNNNNNVRITPDKNGYDKIKLAKLWISKISNQQKIPQTITPWKRHKRSRCKNQTCNS